jgi:hypothetical protein
LAFAKSFLNISLPPVVLSRKIAPCAAREPKARDAPSWLGSGAVFYNYYNTIWAGDVLLFRVNIFQLAKPEGLIKFLALARKILYYKKRASNLSCALLALRGHFSIFLRGIRFLGNSQGFIENAHILANIAGNCRLSAIPKAQPAREA